MKIDSLYKILVDSLYAIKETFTQEELVEELGNRNVMVKDTNLLINYLLEREMIIETSKGYYSVSVERTFQSAYGNSK